MGGGAPKSTGFSSPLREPPPQTAEKHPPAPQPVQRGLPSSTVVAAVLAPGFSHLRKDLIRVGFLFSFFLRLEALQFDSSRISIDLGVTSLPSRSFLPPPLSQRRTTVRPRAGRLAALPSGASW